MQALVSLRLLFLIVTFVALPSVITVRATATVGCVHLSGGKLRFVGKQRPDALAWGSYVDSANTTSNFGKLRIVTSPKQDDALQMRAAGFLEGWLTAERIYDHWNNVHAYFANQLYSGVDLSEADKWLDEQEDWLQQQVADKGRDDPQWRAVGYVMAQFNGLVEGYQARAQHMQRSSSQQHRQLSMVGRRSGDASIAANRDIAVGWLDRSDLRFLNNNGELYDIIDHLHDQKQMAQHQKKQQATGGDDTGGISRTSNVLSRGVLPERVFDIIAKRGRCSAIIKVLGDLSDVMIGHSTWDSYTNALRVYKHYELNLNDADIHSRRLSFTSYPGELFSDDDLYISDTGLVVVETTLHIFEPRLLDSLSPLTIPSWYRVRMAFLRASTGEDWVRMFSMHNSGTYNNQYMVVDLNRFVPYQELQSGFLWVVEQIPDKIHGIDATQVLSYSYWPSYNVPFFEEIYNNTGYPTAINNMLAEDPVKYEGQIRWLKYQVAQRAVIYRRDQGKVQSLADLKALMRYNNWRNDPESSGNPAFSICGRYDLLGTDQALPSGCYDSKVTSYSLALRMESEVVNGPPLTTDNTPFTWEGKWGGAEYAHRGHPNIFDYRFERMNAKDLPLAVDTHGTWLGGA